MSCICLYTIYISIVCVYIFILTIYIYTLSIQKTNEITGANYINFTTVPENRIGDHIWYVSDLSKFQSHYPEWAIRTSLNTIIERIVKSNYELKNR